MVIVPPEVTRGVNVVTGLDGLYIPNSEEESRSYLKTLPYYYRIDLTEQSMLIFNNSNSIHQFRNVVTADGTLPEALSIRIKYNRLCDPRVWKHLVLDRKLWWRFTTVAANQFFHELSEDRDAVYL